MTYNEQIIEIGKSDNGYIQSTIVRQQDIPSIYLSRMVKKKTLSKITNGIYLLDGYLEDEFYSLSLRFKAGIFSRRSALFLNGLTSRQLEQIEMNFPANYNTSSIDNVKCYRVQGKTLDLGISEIITPFGNKVKCYDKERCLCDLFYYNYSDNEEKSYAINEYLKSNPNIDKLLNYAEILGVITEIKSILEVGTFAVS